MPKASKPKKAKEVVHHGKEEKKDQAAGVLKAPPEKSGVINPDELRDRLKNHAAPTLAERIADSRKALEHPVPQGQRLFETHDGEIIIGPEDRSQVWVDRLNNGKGAWALPHR